jgi:hypothetical protein
MLKHNSWLQRKALTRRRGRRTGRNEGVEHRDRAVRAAHVRALHDRNPAAGSHPYPEPRHAIITHPAHRRRGPEIGRVRRAAQMDPLIDDRARADRIRR